MGTRKELLIWPCKNRNWSKADLPQDGPNEVQRTMSFPPPLKPPRARTHSLYLNPPPPIRCGHVSLMITFHVPTALQHAEARHPSLRRTPRLASAEGARSKTAFPSTSMASTQTRISVVLPLPATPRPARRGPAFSERGGSPRAVAEKASRGANALRPRAAGTNGSLSWRN